MFDLKLLQKPAVNSGFLCLRDLHKFRFHQSFSMKQNHLLAIMIFASF